MYHTKVKLNGSNIQQKELFWFFILREENVFGKKLNLTALANKITNITTVHVFTIGSLSELCLYKQL